MSEAHPPLTVVIDACVLFLAAVRDTLLRAAVKRLYRLYVSDLILEELRRNLVVDVGLPEIKARRLVKAIRDAFPGALVTKYDHLVPLMLNHPKDRHVLAAAVKSGARIIVTNNIKDFPPHALQPYGIIALSADAFLLLLLDQDEEGILQVLQEQVAALKSPAMNIGDVLATWLDSLRPTSRHASRSAWAKNSQQTVDQGAAIGPDVRHPSRLHSNACDGDGTGSPSPSQLAPPSTSLASLSKR